MLAPKGGEEAISLGGDCFRFARNDSQGRPGMNSAMEGVRVVDFTTTIAGPHCTRLLAVFCAISGYGQTGPSAGLPAYAPVIHAASGYDLAHLAYQGGDRRPDYCGIYIADVVTGTYAFGAIMTALFQRERTGEGQSIDCS